MRETQRRVFFGLRTSKENQSMPYRITRPGEGISLNAGQPEYVLDSDGKVMDFPSEFHALAFLKSHGVDDPDDELIDIVWVKEEAQ